jgi:hypothetical protein
MPKTQTNTRIHDFARAGAEQRLAVLDQERNDILALFPDLGHAKRGRKPKPDDAAPSATPSRKRRGMNAAQRKAVGVRMKKYWAARRAEKQGDNGNAAAAAQAQLAQRERKGGRKK